MRVTFLSALIGVSLTGCLGGGEVPVGSGGSGAGTGGSASGGASQSGGSTGSGGAIATGGSNASGGNNATGGTGSGTGGATTGTGGGSNGGSTGTGGSASGGSTGSGGRMGTGGGASGGMMATGGAAGGTTAGTFFPKPLRVDDPCGTMQGGNVCLHEGKPSDNGTPFMKMAQITVGGTTGQMYMVKITIKGVTEPTHVSGGTPGTPAQFVTGGSAYANSTNEGQYQQWRLTTTVPNQHYYLNVFREGLSHVVKLLNYTETIMIGGGSIVTLDVNDGNAHQISNTVNNPPLAPPGVPGSMMSGQFVQIDAENPM
jgi:hypothetical protein